MRFGNWKELKEKLESINDEIFYSYNTNELSDYEKRRKIFDYLCDNLSYDYLYLNKIISISNKQTTDYSRNPYEEVENVIYNKVGVCNGIAQTYRILLELNNIYSLCVNCDNGMEVSHQLNLVYDKTHYTYSFDDITSVLIGIDSKDNLFDYDKEYASSINQGNKNIMNEEDGEWMFLTALYLDTLLGRKSDFYKQFNIDNGFNWHLPSNIKSIKKSNIIK